MPVRLAGSQSGLSMDVPEVWSHKRVSPIWLQRGVHQGGLPTWVPQGVLQWVSTNSEVFSSRSVVPQAGFPKDFLQIGSRKSRKGDANDVGQGDPKSRHTRGSPPDIGHKGVTIGPRPQMGPHEATQLGPTSGVPRGVPQGASPKVVSI
jgi:hypothetical protein